jgi:hypothetical protein
MNVHHAIEGWPKRPHIAEEELDTAVLFQVSSWTSPDLGRRVGVAGEQKWS